MTPSAEPDMRTQDDVSEFTFKHVQCSKLFKGIECTALSMVLCTIKKP